MYRKILKCKAGIFTIFLVLTVFFSCNDTNKIEAEIAKVPIDLQVARFDREFASAQPKDIPRIKTNYPYLFPRQYADSVWMAKLSDTLQVELLKEVEKVFPDFEQEALELENLYKHIKYYFPQTKVPKVVTLTSDVQYENRIILTDSLLLIGLDNYLGADHKFYVDIQNYIKSNLDKEYLVSDVASAFAKQVVPKPQSRNFLASMVYYGKELYIKDQLLPSTKDYLKINYSQDQLEWAKANEEPIWRNYIENEYLFSTDAKLSRRFLDPAPFSKFGLELDNESPGRIGRYMGWQIVRAFMDNNKVSLQQMLNLPAEEIFKKSNFKPSK